MHIKPVPFPHGQSACSMCNPCTTWQIETAENFMDGQNEDNPILYCKFENERSMFFPPQLYFSDGKRLFEYYIHGMTSMLNAFTGRLLKYISYLIFSTCIMLCHIKREQSYAWQIAIAIYGQHPLFYFLTQNIIIKKLYYFLNINFNIKYIFKGKSTQKIEQTWILLTFKLEWVSTDSKWVRDK